MGMQSVLVGNRAPARRVIKRYSNRKLYDTRASRYVTLLQIADMVRAGEEVQIIDNATKEDKTEVTMALIISEELKERPRIIPRDALKAIIQFRGERVVERGLSGVHDSPDSMLRRTATSPNSMLRRTANGPLIQKDPFVKTPAIPPEGTSELEQRQLALERKLSGLADSVEMQALRSQVQHLSERLAALERQFNQS